MTSTRLTTLITFVAGTAGLVMLTLDRPITVPISGAALVIGSAILFARHFWRESDRKRKQELATYARTLSTETAKLAEDGRNSQAEVTEHLTSLGLRQDAFSKGVLEYVTQLELDLRNARTELSKRFDSSDRQAIKHRDKGASQVAGVIGVYSTLKPKTPYPSFGGFAISGDCALRLLSLIFTEKPRWIIEAGSGLSTVLVAQALELIGGEGHVISLEHEKKWLDLSNTMLAEHNVSHRATIVHAPLVDTQIGDEVFRWYDVTGAPLPDQSQIIFVDGPPSATGPMARYPALHKLYDHLAETGVLLMDDADRPDERSAVERWKEEFRDLDIVYHADSRGTLEIRKPAS